MKKLIVVFCFGIFISVSFSHATQLPSITDPGDCDTACVTFDIDTAWINYVEGCDYDTACDTDSVAIGPWIYYVEDSAYDTACDTCDTVTIAVPWINYITFDTVYDTYDTVTVTVGETDPWINYVEESRNPIVERISEQEILNNSTPAAVAYNFVKAILDRDLKEMWKLANGEFNSIFFEELFEKHNGNEESLLTDWFSEGKLGVYQWLPALNEDHEVAIAYIQDESMYLDYDELWGPVWSRHFNQTLKDGQIYLPDESIPRTTLIQKKIYVICCPSKEVNHAGFQDITRYSNTNVKVLVQYEDGKWKVAGFK